MSYSRLNAVEYAREWAYKRNPNYFNFTGIGGDCTNFVSQCLHAGGAKMNERRPLGWYYNSINDRSPSWTGVQFFYNFLIHNKGVGPFAIETEIGEMLPGDVVQLSFEPDVFGHSLFVVAVGENPTLDNVLIATHTIDSYARPLSTYDVLQYRYLKIKTI